jgi:hypothetical protein
VSKIEGLEIQIMGGLGNQLHGFVAGMVIANRLGLKLIVNSERVRFGSNLSRRPEIHQLLPDKLLDSVLFEDGSFMKLKFGYEKARRASRGMLPHVNFFSEPDFLDSGMSVSTQLTELPETTRSVGGPFIDYEWADQASLLGFPTHLSLKSPSEIFENVSSDVTNESVAIHIRLGDYLSLPEIFPIPSEGYYLEALHSLEATKTCPIHVYTDSPKKILIRYPRLLAFPNTQVIDVKSELSSVEVMTLMSKYNRLVATNSTFSSWAAWFSPYKLVTTPTPHLNSNWIDRMPAKWQRLPINL